MNLGTKRLQKPFMGIIDLVWCFESFVIIKLVEHTSSLKIFPVEYFEASFGFLTGGGEGPLYSLGICLVRCIRLLLVIRQIFLCVWLVLVYSFLIYIFLKTSNFLL